jgi:hypothetical protein
MPDTRGVVAHPRGQRQHGTNGNRPIVGLPIAPARCSGPESIVTTMSSWLTMDAVSAQSRIIGAMLVTSISAPARTISSAAASAAVVPMRIVGELPPTSARLRQHQERSDRVILLPSEPRRLLDPRAISVPILERFGGPALLDALISVWVDEKLVSFAAKRTAIHFGSSGAPQTRTLVPGLVRGRCEPSLISRSANERQQTVWWS